MTRTCLTFCFLLSLALGASTLPYAHGDTSKEEQQLRAKAEALANQIADTFLGVKDFRSPPAQYRAERAEQTALEAKRLLNDAAATTLPNWFRATPHEVSSALLKAGLTGGATVFLSLLFGASIEGSSFYYAHYQTFEKLVFGPTLVGGAVEFAMVGLFSVHETTTIGEKVIGAAYALPRNAWIAIKRFASGSKATAREKTLRKAFVDALESELARRGMRLERRRDGSCEAFLTNDPTPVVRIKDLDSISFVL